MIHRWDDLAIATGEMRILNYRVDHLGTELLSSLPAIGSRRVSGGTVSSYDTSPTPVFQPVAVLVLSLGHSVPTESTASKEFSMPSEWPS